MHQKWRRFRLGCRTDAQLFGVDNKFRYQVAPARRGWLRSGRRFLVLLLALLLAGPVSVRAQMATVPGDLPQAAPDDDAATPAGNPEDQSPRDMIGSRWPVVSDDEPPTFVAKRTDRLSEAMREVQAEQEAAAKQAEADARAAEQAGQRAASRFARYHGKGKRLAARGRAMRTAATRAGKNYATKPSVKRQASKVRGGRHHRAG
jgi:hypothetical protein